MISLILKFGFVIANSASYETRKSRWICSTLRFVLGLVRAPPRGGEAEEAAIKFDSCQPSERVAMWTVTSESASRRTESRTELEMCPVCITLAQHTILYYLSPCLLAEQLAD